MKYCCFRFDVDTHACVTRGMPALLRIAATLDVRFTFFVNMGRAFDRRITMTKALRRLFRREKVSHISAAAKLGLFDSVLAAALNPKAGPASPEILRAARDAGHEIGVHGGRNHAQWERYAHTWTEDRLRGEVLASLEAMRTHGMPDASSFASPAWNSPPCLKELLPSVGFRILADTYDPNAEGPTEVGENFTLVPTNITAGSGRAGYLETLRMAGVDGPGIIDHFEKQLDAKKRFAVVYDHPCFAGVHAPAVVKDLIRTAIDSGFSVCTIKEAVTVAAKPGSTRIHPT